jgi:hypothetical protein
MLDYEYRVDGSTGFDASGRFVITFYI